MFGLGRMLTGRKVREPLGSRQPPSDERGHLGQAAVTWWDPPPSAGSSCQGQSVSLSGRSCRKPAGGEAVISNFNQICTLISRGGPGSGAQIQLPGVARAGFRRGDRQGELLAHPSQQLAELLLSAHAQIESSGSRL